MNRTPNISRTHLDEYLREEGRVEREIWSVIDVRGKTVIDVGAGESTKKLRELGATVIAVDNDPEKVKGIVEMGVPLILCDFLQFPFRTRLADIVVFYFTLHEINPVSHYEAVSIACELAPRIMIVEPSPKGCEIYEEYSSLWREAMHSVGRFEDYRPIEYWKSLLEEAELKVTSKTITWSSTIPPNKLEEIIKITVKEWKRMEVKQEYITRIKELLERAKEIGMRWSDINVLVGIS